MAHLFVDLGNDDSEHDESTALPVHHRTAWGVARLEGDVFALGGGPEETLRPRRVEAALEGEESERGIAAQTSPPPTRAPSATRPTANNPERAPLLMRSVVPEGGESWIAVTEPGGPLRVNGIPLMTGVRVLPE